jgi:hypothetical protein
MCALLLLLCRCPDIPQPPLMTAQSFVLPHSRVHIPELKAALQKHMLLAAQACRQLEGSAEKA